MEKPSTASPDQFAAFQRLMKKLVAVSKRDVDRKIVAYKKRKKKQRSN